MHKHISIAKMSGFESKREGMMQVRQVKHCLLQRPFDLISVRLREPFPQ